MDALNSFSSPQLQKSRSRANCPPDSPEQDDDRDERSPQQDIYSESSLRQAEDLDDREELCEGERQQDELLDRHPLWNCPTTASLLEEILGVLLVHCQRPEVSYEFWALDSKVPFASSCSNGAVYFSRALTESLSPASVLYFAAHEMAHTELRHYATRQRRLQELRRGIPAAPGSAVRQRMELAAVLAVRHQEEFEADHHAARWTDFPAGQRALEELHRACQRLSPESLKRPTHPSFEGRLDRLAGRVAPPDPLDYLWSLVKS